MADEFCWTMTGTTQWSRRYRGKQIVINELFRALRAKLKAPIVVDAYRFIADDDYVAVEARGRNSTTDGLPYNNHYCYVFRLSGGRQYEMTEYLDTELVSAALSSPV